MNWFINEQFHFSRRQSNHISPYRSHILSIYEWMWNLGKTEDHVKSISNFDEEDIQRIVIVFWFFMGRGDACKWWHGSKPDPVYHTVYRMCLETIIFRCNCMMKVIALWYNIKVYRWYIVSISLRITWLRFCVDEQYVLKFAKYRIQIYLESVKLRFSGANGPIFEYWSISAKGLIIIRAFVFWWAYLTHNAR